MTIPIARRVGPSGEVVALDVQEGMLDRVRTRVVEVGLTNVRTVCVPLQRNAASEVLRSASFDRALLVTVLGEVPDPASALDGLFEVLKPGAVLSITEMMIDPDYVRRNVVTDLAHRAGFRLEHSFGNALMFTLNFRKPEGRSQ